MHPRTAELKRQITRATSLQQKLDLLENAYAGATCYLLTCGPSINQSFDEEARRRLSGELVVAVKQTLTLAPEIVDFHLLNAWNYQPYAYPAPGPIVLSEQADGDPPTPGLQPDLAFRVGDPRDFSRRLATTLHFEEWLFTRTHDRPWGPGVVYELGIYLLVHLGVKEIVTLGWDLGEANSTTMEHFFAEAAPGSREQDGIANKPGIRTFEVGDIARSTHALYYWLRARGIYLNVVSDRSLVDPIVPRVELSDPVPDRRIVRTELLANGSLTAWEGDTPRFWQPGRRTRPILRRLDGSDGVGRVEIAPRRSFARSELSQQASLDPYFRGGVVRAKMRARSSEPGKFGLSVTLLEAGNGARPVRVEATHPGDGDWHTVDVTAPIPSTSRARAVRLCAELQRGASAPVHLEHVSATLER